MKLVVAGSRSFNDYNTLESELNKIVGISEIISGGAIGADTLANIYAKNHNIPLKIFYPDWKTHGKSAGYVRNKLMVEYGEQVICFWDGDSPGTKITIDLTNKNKKPLTVVNIKLK